MQHGDILFLLQNLVLKDFRIRYRNMSLGVTWSVANPLLMMGILTFVFTRIYPNPTIHHFALFALCALVPFNFYSLASITGTTSLLENQSLIKRVRCPRAIFPIAAVLSSSLHFLIQIALLIFLLLVFGHGVNRYWLWLLPIWTMEVVFLCGLSLITSALDIYYRDVRYLVECSGLVMFWMVPVFYNLEMIPHRYRALYMMNPDRGGGDHRSSDHARGDRALDDYHVATVRGVAGGTRARICDLRTAGTRFGRLSVRTAIQSSGSEAMLQPERDGLRVLSTATLAHRCSSSRTSARAICAMRAARCSGIVSLHG